MNKLDLTVIIPLHQYSDDVKNMLVNALDSIKNQTTQPSWLVIVGPDDVVKSVEKDGIWFDQTMYLVNDGLTDFCSQINKAVSEVKTEWFSILEFDDLYTPILFNNFEKFKNDSNKLDVGLYLSINNIIDKEGKHISFMNEIIHAMGFAEDTALGFIDIKTLKTYSEYQMTGGIFKTEDFIEVGGLKPSMKVTFWNEFIMRFCENGKKVFVMPKIGYVHTMGRENSLTDWYQKNMDVKEVEFWIKTAKKEYFFKEDRNKQYTKE